MIISSHRLDEVSSLVNRVIEMDMGKVVLDDKVADDATLTDTLACRIVLKRFEPAFAKARTAGDFAERCRRRVGGTGRLPALIACASSASFRATRRWSPIWR